MRYFLLSLLFVSGALAQEKSCVSVVTIHGAGSGTVVAKDGETRYVLTNKHVVSATDKKVWVIYDRKRYDAKFIKAHPDVDLALVSVQIDAEPVVLAATEPKEGDEIKHFGKATGPQEGKVTGWTNFQSSDGVVMDSSVFSVPGDSGAGLFNSKGQLVSVHYGRKGPPEGETVAISVRLSNVRAFLKEYAK